MLFACRITESRIHIPAVYFCYSSMATMITRRSFNATL